MTIGKGKAGSPQAVLAPCNNNSGAFSPPSSAPPAPVPSMEARGAGQRQALQRLAVASESANSAVRINLGAGGRRGMMHDCLAHALVCTLHGGARGRAGKQWSYY